MKSNVCYVIDPEEMLQAAQHGDVAKGRQLLASDTTLVNATEIAELLKKKGVGD